MEPPGREKNNLQRGEGRGNGTAVRPPGIPTAVLGIPMALQSSSVSPHQAQVGVSMQRTGCRMGWRAMCEGYRSVRCS